MLINTPSELVTGLGFAAFSLLLLAMPLAFWAVSSRSSAGSVRVLVAIANLLLTAQLVLRWWQCWTLVVEGVFLLHVWRLKRTWRTWRPEHA